MNSILFDFNLFIIQGTNKHYYDTIGDGRCGWYALSQLSRRYSTSPNLKQKYTDKPIQRNLKSRATRTKFQSFIR